MVHRHVDGVIATMTATPLVSPNARLVGTAVSGDGGEIEIGGVITSAQADTVALGIGRRGDGRGDRVVRVPCLRSAWPFGGVPAVATARLVPTSTRPATESASTRYLAVDRVDVLIVAIFLSTLVSRGGLGHLVTF